MLDLRLTTLYVGSSSVLEPLRSCLHEHLASAGPLLGLSSSSLAAKAASRALEAGADLSGLPDLSVVYLLYLESGKLINLRDWMTVRGQHLRDGCRARMRHRR